MGEYRIFAAISRMQRAPIQCEGVAGDLDVK